MLKSAGPRLIHGHGKLRSGDKYHCAPSVLQTLRAMSGTSTITAHYTGTPGNSIPSSGRLYRPLHNTAPGVLQGPHGLTSGLASLSLSRVPLAMPHRQGLASSREAHPSSRMHVDPVFSSEVERALRYVSQVKVRLAGQPDEFARFVAIMADFMAARWVSARPRRARRTQVRPRLASRLRPSLSRSVRSSADIQSSWRASPNSCQRQRRRPRTRPRCSPRRTDSCP